MKKKLTRAEKNELTRKNLMESAVKVVGQIGYKDASVTDITTRAKVAQGTFYNYFESRQDILDALLPELGEDLLEFLGKQVGDATFLEREEKSIRAYFQFLKEKPEFYRILVEAQVYSPESFSTHADNLVRNYESALKKTRERGFLKNYADSEFEAIALILLGARVYLSRQYCFKNGKVAPVPEAVVKTYMKLISEGLGAESERNNKRSRSSQKPVERHALFECEPVHVDGCDYAASYVASSSFEDVSELDFYLQQLLADFTRQAMKHTLGENARIRSSNTHLLTPAPTSPISATCRTEMLSEIEGILHIRLGGEWDGRRPVATCQVLFILDQPKARD